MIQDPVGSSTKYTSYPKAIREEGEKGDGWVRNVGLKMSSLVENSMVRSSRRMVREDRCPHISVESKGASEPVLKNISQTTSFRFISCSLFRHK